MVRQQGGSGFGEAHPRHVGGQPPTIGSHYVSAPVMRHALLWALLDIFPRGHTIRVKHVHLVESGLMQKKLTITLDETVYDGLHRVIGRRRISRFIEELVRPYILAQELDAAYQHMAQDETREAEALAWSEATVSDVSDAPR